jgi:hypothetical protein
VVADGVQRGRARGVVVDVVARRERDRIVLGDDGDGDG